MASAAYDVLVDGSIHPRDESQVTGYGTLNPGPLASAFSGLDNVHGERIFGIDDDHTFESVYAPAVTRPSVILAPVKEAKEGSKITTREVFGCQGHLCLLLNKNSAEGREMALFKHRVVSGVYLKQRKGAPIADSKLFLTGVCKPFEDGQLQYDHVQAVYPLASDIVLDKNKAQHVALAVKDVSDVKTEDGNPEFELLPGDMVFAHVMQTGNVFLYNSPIYPGDKVPLKSFGLGTAVNHTVAGGLYKHPFSVCLAPFPVT